jgi:hypothetical protein
MFCAKLASYNIHIDVLLDILIIGIIDSDHINFHEIMFSHETKNVEKLKKLF